ncbi:MAG: GGDEF domain-containing protein, partial [Sphaerochaetaceae bacterium]
MNIPSWLVINIYSFIFLAMLFLFTIKNRESKVQQQRMFRLLLIFLALLIVFDSMGRIQAADRMSRLCAMTGNFLIFLLDPLMIFAWMEYAGMLCNVAFAKKHRWFIPLWVFCALNAAATILSLKWGWVFWFDVSGQYHRGPLFSLRSLLMIVEMAYLEVFIVKNSAFTGNRFEKFFFFLPLIPLAGAILQILFYGLPLGYAGATVAMLIVHVFAQNQDINIDYLTGAYNRRRLDLAIKEKVRAGVRFSAIMLDIDHFKGINDTYGHGMGDIALQDTVDLLRSCFGLGEIIARYGGDEFCVVSDIRDTEDLQRAVECIRKHLGMYNAKSLHPFTLGFSVGYDVFDPSSEMSAEEFLRHIDILMYQMKLSSRSAPDRA